MVSLIGLYHKMGGEAGVRVLVDRFYDLMEDLPEAKSIRALHPADLGESRQKLFEFLVGWSGGPPRYTEKYGHPRLRIRHMPFSIGAPERDAWLHCMRQALSEQGWPEDIVSYLFDRFAQIADFMRNQDE